MAYSATLAHLRGLLTAADHRRLLNLFSRAGLSMDHPQFDAALLEKATAAIMKTRDGKLRAAVPVSPMGECVFLNDVSHGEMCAALEAHKKLMQEYPRKGEGLEAYVDGSDTGYDVNGKPVEAVAQSSVKENGLGVSSNGHAAILPDGLKETVNGWEHSQPAVVAVADGHGAA